MTVSLEAEIDTIFKDVRIAKSDIRAGKLVDLTPLESKIKGVCFAVSDKKKHSLVADSGMLQRHLKALVVSLEYLENLVTAKNEGLLPPKSSREPS